jgi:uncharacterized protein
VDFINRHEELRRLDHVARDPRGGLVVLWGRRRVGKTRLLVDWCGARRGLYFVADQSAAALQRQYFATAVASVFPGFADVEYRDWGALLRRLATEAKQARWRRPLVIDELPYLVEASPELPSVLQRFVDHEAKDAGLVVVIAGSSQRMMQGLVLDAAAPLYGRARELMPLLPLGAGWLPAAFAKLTPAQAVERFAVWGGSPHHWELARSLGANATLEDTLDRLVLSPSGPLHREPDQLLMEEQPPATSLRPILDAIGMGAHRLAEIGARVGVPATSLSRPMQRLIELGLVEREIPFGDSEKGQKRSLYQIADPFFRLWFRIVAPHRSFLAQANAKSRVLLWRKHRALLVSQTWEQLCRACVPHLAGAAWAPARRSWNASGPEWDVVALSVDGSAALAGEVKWHDGIATAAQLRAASTSLRAKGVPPAVPSSARLQHTVFVPTKPRGALARAGAGDVDVIDARAVLAALR